MALVSYFFVVVENLCFCYESLFHFDSELYKHSFFLWSKSNFISKFPISYFSTHKNSKFENSFFLFSSVSSIPFSEGTNWKTITETPIFSLYLHYFAHCFLFFFLDFCLKWLLSSPFFFSSHFPSLPYSSSSFFIIFFFERFKSIGRYHFHFIIGISSIFQSVLYYLVFPAPYQTDKI